MVIFKGISLNDVASEKISDIIVESPKIATATKENPIARGEYFVRRKYSPRRIIIEFYFKFCTPTKKAELFHKITSWANSETPQVLRLPHYPGKYIKAACTALPDLSAILKSDKMRIEFTAFDPAFISDEVKNVPCGTPFTIAGEFPALAYIQQINAGAVMSPSWALDALFIIALSGSIPAGTIKIDLENKSVSLNNTPIMDKFNISSRFFELGPGNHTVSGTGTIYYQERWL